MSDRSTEILLRATDLAGPAIAGANLSDLSAGHGLERLLECQDAEFVVLRSTAARIDPEHLAALEALMDRHPDAAIAAMSFRPGDHPTSVHAGLDFPHAAIPRRVNGVREENEETFLAVWSPCMIVRTSAARMVGLRTSHMSAAYAWFELGLRAQRRGWTVRVLHDCPVATQEASGDYRLPAPPASFSAAWNRHLTQASQDRQVLALLRRSAPASAARTIELGSTPARVRVLVDLARVAPGGATGGIKVFTIELLRAVARTHHDALQFLWLLPAPLASEALRFVHPGDEIWLLPDKDAPPAPDVRIRQLTQADSSLSRSLMADVLYAPLGVSDFRLPDIPTIGTAVDVLHRDMPDALPAHDVVNREGWFSDMAATDALIQCISRWTADRVARHFQVPSSRLVVTYCAVQSRLRTIPAAGERRGFLYPANAWPHKNHKLLLEGFAAYLAAHRAGAWDLVLTGHPDAAMEAIARQIAVLGIDSHVKLHGYLDLDDFSELWAQTGALIFPSLYEGFGIPLLEAMRLGVPIIAGREGSIPEVVGDACLFVDVRDPASIADGMFRVQNDAALRGDLIRRGHARAGRFDLDSEARTMARVFLDTARSARAMPSEYYIGWVAAASPIHDQRSPRTDASLPDPAAGMPVTLVPESAVTESPSPDLLHHVDAPLSWSDPVHVIFVRGWCFATRGTPVVGVAVRVGNEQRTGAFGLPRPDVARHFDRPDVVDCGFSVAVPRQWCAAKTVRLVVTREDGSINALLLQPVR